MNKKKMKKMTWSEYQQHKRLKRIVNSEMGVIDFEERRVAKMWNDPLVKDEDIPCTKFTWDEELKEFVFAGHENSVDRNEP